MKKSSLVIVLGLFVCISCGGDEDNSAPIQAMEVDAHLSNSVLPVYNQAYQENFEADDIADILVSAVNAYVIIDPFEDDIASAIPALKANGNQIGAYISIGTGETYRDDYNEMKASLVTTPWGEWPDEFFVSSTVGVIDIMKARIDQIAIWGCDWVEFDNMDWAEDDDLRTTYGFQVSQADAIAYYNELCAYVHQKGMKCMAKNTVSAAESFDGVLYESYHDDKNWWDASGAKGFLTANKLVIINHYDEEQCDQVYEDYKVTYGSGLSFICEDRDLKMYVHYNQ